MPNSIGYMIVGGVAAAVTFVLVPLVAWVARRVGWVAVPDARRVHTRVTPDVGGIAMIGGLLAAVAVAWEMDRFRSLFVRNSEPLGVVLAAAVIFVIGLLDDVKDLSAPAKVTGTVVAGAVLVYFGVTMFYFRVPFLDVFSLDDWAPLVTVLWLLGMTTAINLIDGLDGLAAGTVAIAAIAFFLYSRRLSQLGLLVEPNVGPLFAIIAVGICVGFLPFNFSPARIFMGDSGALLLGLLMAVSTSVVGGRADPNTQRLVGQTYFFFAPLFIPLCVLGVPVLDTAFAVVRRARLRQGVATADKGHLHHRLMNLGHGQRRSVFILWCWTALLSIVVLVPVYSGSPTWILPGGAVAVGIALYTVLHPSAREARRTTTIAKPRRASRPGRRRGRRRRTRVTEA